MSLTNPETGRSKKCSNFTVSELKSMCRARGLPNHWNSKERLCAELLRSFGYRSHSKKSRRSQSKKSRRSHSKKSRRSRSKSKKPARKTTARKAKRVSRTRSYSRPKYWVQPSGRVIPYSGSGSFQKRHFSSKRKGPSLPAQSYCGSTRTGNDGNLWRSVPDKNGNCHWKKL